MFRNDLTIVPLTAREDKLSDLRHVAWSQTQSASGVAVAPNTVPLEVGDSQGFEQRGPRELVERLCLSDDQVQQLNQLAERCEQVYGPARDIEWAIAAGSLYLLQCRAITKAGG